jgi:surface carbohydrate biosynthesis protein
MSSLPLLIIPYEILVREIDGAILLAQEYIKRGGSCLLGHKTTLLPFPFLLPNSIWFLKSIVPGEIFVQKRILKSKSKIFSYDVEGLVPSVGEIGVRQRMNELTLSTIELHFCWNQEEATLYSSTFPDYVDKFIASGIPIQYSWSIAQSLSRGKPKRILIISSFPLICPLNSEYSRQQSIKCSGSIVNQQSQFRSEISMQQDGYKNMHDLIAYLTRSGYSITIRKHPAELSNLWKDFASSPLVEFDTSSRPIVESLLSASAVFCLNSTVSVQCKAMSIPCFQFLPHDFLNTYSSILSEISLSNSTIFNSLPDIIPQVNSSAQNPIPPSCTDPSPVIVDKFLTSQLPLSPVSKYIYLTLQLFIYLRRTYIFLLYMLSRLPFSRHLLGPRYKSPVYYRVFHSKCPASLSTSLPLCFDRLSINSSNLHISVLDDNLVLLKPVN